MKSFGLRERRELAYVFYYWGMGKLVHVLYTGRKTKSYRMNILYGDKREAMGATGSTRLGSCRKMAHRIHKYVYIT